MLEPLFSASEKNIFQMMTGFFTSKLLAVGVELDLFTWLATRSQSFTDIRAYLGFAERPCRIFLDTLLSLGLLEKKDDLYHNSYLADTLLVKGRPDFQGPHVRLFDNLYRACDDLKSALLENRPTNQDYSYFFDAKAKEVTHYSTLMHDSSVVPSMVLPQYWDFSDSRRIMDVGGGYGRLCLTLLSQHPQLEAVLFDLPAVCSKAKELLETYPPGLTSRLHLHPGNFFRDPFPAGTDTIVMMRVIHDWPLENVKILFRKACEALPSGGRLLVYETFKDQESCPGDAALISMLLLLISPGGECRTFAEIKALLEEVGFVHVEFIPTVYFYGLVVAEKA
jgi:hypothetical protein